jgi:hypothetical protein
VTGHTFPKDALPRPGVWQKLPGHTGCSIGNSNIPIRVNRAAITVIQDFSSDFEGNFAEILIRKII